VTVNDNDHRPKRACLLLLLFHYQFDGKRRLLTEQELLTPQQLAHSDREYIDVV
jgi:hypothetical protein